MIHQISWSEQSYPRPVIYTGILELGTMWYGVCRCRRSATDAAWQIKYEVVPSQVPPSVVDSILALGTSSIRIIVSVHEAIDDLIFGYAILYSLVRHHGPELIINKGRGVLAHLRWLGILRGYTILTLHTIIHVECCDALRGLVWFKLWVQLRCIARAVVLQPNCYGSISRAYFV